MKMDHRELQANQYNIEHTQYDIKETQINNEDSQHNLKKTQNSVFCYGSMFAYDSTKHLCECKSSHHALRSE